MSGFWAGVALLTKFSAIVLLPISLFRIVQFRFNKNKSIIIKWTIVNVLAWFIGFIIFLVRNFIQYGSILALNPGVQTQFSFSFDHLVWSIRNLVWSFWLAFGRTYEITPSPVVYLIVIIPFFILAIYGWSKIYKVNSNLLHLIIFSAFCAISSSLFYTLLYPKGEMTSWGKNLYPVLPFFALFFVIGWNSVSKKRTIKISISAILIMVMGCFWVLLEFHNMLN